MRLTSITWAGGGVLPHMATMSQTLLSMLFAFCALFAERNAYRTSLGMAVGEKIMYTAEIMSRDQYVPKNPNQSDLDNIFDLSFPTVQPYLFKVSNGLSLGHFFFFGGGGWSIYLRVFIKSSQYTLIIPHMAIWQCPLLVPSVHGPQMV